MECYTFGSQIANHGHIVLEWVRNWCWTEIFNVDILQSHKNNAKQMQSSGSYSSFVVPVQFRTWQNTYRIIWRRKK